MTEEPAAGPSLDSGSLVTGLLMASGPQLILIQLLPSSTVAAGVRLKTGFGTVASEIPGGTCQPRPAVVFSGGIREPLQYWIRNVGGIAVLLAAYPVVLVITE